MAILGGVAVSYEHGTPVEAHTPIPRPLRSPPHPPCPEGSPLEGQVQVQQFQPNSQQFEPKFQKKSAKFSTVSAKFSKISAQILNSFSQIRRW